MPGCTASGVSELFSTLSLTSWICAQLPQIIANYRTKSAEGISPLFLLLWFLGDFLSFSSCLLNDAALNFQVYLSMFFLANDLTLCYQYYYYNSVYPRKHFHSLSQNDMESQPQSAYIGATHSTEIHDQMGAIHIRQTGHMGKPIRDSFNANNTEIATKEAVPTPSSSLSSCDDDKATSRGFGSTGTSPKLGKMAATAGMLLHTGVTQALATESTNGVLVSSYKETLGLVLAWGCTCVYVSSRCPQLYKNYLRKSVDGISPLLFGSALLGNLAYTLSVLTSCEFVSSDNRMEFFWKQLPYLLGSSGTILFDIAYFYQRYIYRESGRDSTEMGLQPWEEEE